MHVFGIKSPIGHAPSNPLAKLHGSPLAMDDFYDWGKRSDRLKFLD